MFLGRLLVEHVVYVECVYMFILTLLCVQIYRSTKDLYEVSGDQGIALFRKTFIFLALGVISRFIQIILTWHYGRRLFFEYGVLARSGLILSALFSTLAILYLLCTITVKGSFDDRLDYAVWFFAILLVAIRIFFLQDLPLIMIVHATLACLCLLYIFLQEGNRMQNVYVLLALFWVLHTAILVYHFTLLQRLFAYCIFIAIIYYVYSHVKRYIV